jgi:hypothetical protein
MSITFPTSPTIGQTFTEGLRTWIWDGVMWAFIVDIPPGPEGPAGPTGPQGVQGEPGSALKHVEIIGDGINSEYTITHNLNTFDVVVSIYDSGFGDALVFAGVKCLNENSIKVTFGQVAGVNHYRVVVLG